MAQTGKEPDVLSAPVTRLSTWARSTRLPRHTVRLRLTVLYGGLFLLCGAGLLAVTNALVRYDKVAAVPAGLLGASDAGKGAGIAVERISSSGLPASHGGGATGVAQAAGAATYAATLH